MAGTGVPDFTALPSTYPHRSPEPEIFNVDDSDDSDGPTAISPPPKTPANAKAPTSARAATKRKTKTIAVADVPVFEDIKLISELDERWRTFYAEHWRRGADGDDDDGGNAGGGRFGSSASTFGTFGVPAPAAAARKAASSSSTARSWRPRGRGRGKWRGRR
jgi:hypothetical protein